MKITSQSGKHRAPGRTVTPLTILARNAGASMDTVGRKSIVAVAASSMLATLVAAPAHADNNDTPSGGVDVSTLTSSLRTVLNESPEVLVADGAFAIEAAVTDVKPAPVVRRAAPTRARTTAAPVSRTVKRVDPMSIEAEGKARTLIDAALEHQGTKYVHGGTSPNGFDCSGFTKYVYAKIGINLPRTTPAQRKAGTVVTRANAQPGDLIWSPGHVGIYLGNGKQIDAPRPGKTIQVRSIWQKNPTFLRVIKN